MIIEGYAFKADEREIQEKNRQRLQEISHLTESLNIKKNPQYGHVRFSGVLATDEAKQLSEHDLALIADFGNLCFGGECTKSGDRFSGKYYTD